MVQRVFSDDFLLPFLTDMKKGMKSGMMSVFAVMITLIVVNLMVLFILRSTTSTKNYPVMNVSRYISLADFFEHLESAIMAVWIVGAFVKISVFYYAVCFGYRTVAESLRLSSCCMADRDFDCRIQLLVVSQLHGCQSI